MSKKTAGGLLGTMLIAGAAAGIAKYLKDYAGASYTNDEEIKNVKKNSAEVKKAAKRTYIAIKEKQDIKDAAGDLLEAAGNVVSDAGSIAKTAGTGVYHAAKEIKERYDEDPEAAKDEMVNNIKDMGHELMGMAADAADSVVNKFTQHDDEDDINCDCGCCCEKYTQAEANRDNADDEDPEIVDRACGCCCNNSNSDTADTKSSDEDVSENTDASSDDASNKIEIEADDDSSSLEISDAD